MSVINSFVYKNIKLNYKRSIATIIGILLSVSLVCCISSFASSYYATVLNQEISQNGYFHVKLESLNDDEVKTASSNIKFNSIKVSDIGYGLIESDNNSKQYSHLLSLESIDHFDDFKFELIEGNFPTNSNEIVISNHVYTNANNDSYKVGDVITLDAGTRYYNDGGDEIIRESYLQYVEDEKLKDITSYDFTVVGIIDRPGYLFEDYSNAGYSFITVGLQSDISNLFLTSKSTKDIYKDVYMLLDIEKNDLNHEYALYNHTINHSLIRNQNIDFSDPTLLALGSVILFVIAIIVFVSVYCIKNAFSISYSEKSKMMSMLKSIGSTKKQIRSILIKEANILSIIGIPLGVISGILACYSLVVFLNFILSKYGEFVIVFNVNWIVVVFTCFIGYITVLLSVLNVARLASKVTPIENIKNSDQIKINPKKLKVPKIITKLFGLGGELAYKNMQRSKRKYRTTVYSIATCIFVFISMNGFVSIMELSTNSFYNAIDYSIQICSYSFEDRVSNSGLFSILDDMDYTVYSRDIASSMYMDEEHLTEYFEGQSLYTGIYLLEDQYFDEYLDTLGLSEGNFILNNMVKVDVFRTYTTYQSHDTFKSSYDIQGETIEMIEHIDMVTSKLPKNMNPNEVYNPRIIMRYDYFMDKYDISDSYLEAVSITTDQPYEVEKNINDYIELHDIDNVHVNNYQQLIDENQDFVLLLSVFLYGFIFVISLIGLTNIFNTIHSNITLRKVEFATLKSIGMTSKEFNKMMNLETLFYCSKALFIGIVTGTIGCMIFNVLIEDVFYIRFYFPTYPIIISIIGVLVLVYVIMRYSLKMIQKETIIETIKNLNI